MSDFWMLSPSRPITDANGDTKKDVCIIYQPKWYFGLDLALSFEEEINNMMEFQKRGQRGVHYNGVVLDSVEGKVHWTK